MEAAKEEDVDSLTGEEDNYRLTMNAFNNNKSLENKKQLNCKPSILRQFLLAPK